MSDLLDPPEPSLEAPSSGSSSRRRPGRVRPRSEADIPENELLFDSYRSTYPPDIETNPSYPDSFLSILCISDTHLAHESIQLSSIPQIDILVFAGDFLSKQHWRDADRLQSDIESFNAFLGELHSSGTVTVSIVICGNHDRLPDSSNVHRDFLSNATYYLEDSLLCLPLDEHFENKIISPPFDEGLYIYGTPWTTSRRMAFSMSSSKINRKWELIDPRTQILISHLPPYNIMDLAWVRKSQGNAVCELCKKTHPNHRHWGSDALRDRSEKMSVGEEVTFRGRIQKGRKKRRRRRRRRRGLMSLLFGRNRRNEEEETEEETSEEVMRNKRLLLHVFGHNHDDSGIMVSKHSGLTYINASLPNPEMRDPIVYYLKIGQ